VDKKERREGQGGMMNLAEGTFTDHSVEVEVIKRDLAGEIDVLGGRTTHDSIVGKGRGRGRG